MPVDAPTPVDGNDLQQKIMKLIDQLETEVSTLRLAHTTELETLTMRCRQDMQQIHLHFSNELDMIEQKHQNVLSKLAEEIVYLKEMSQSQRLMMETNLEYIRELEQRYLNLQQAKQP